MWWNEYARLCGQMSDTGKLVLAGDLGIAFAYLMIPLGLLVVWRKKLEDLPYPWMLGLFAAFIIACGFTHLVHALEMPFTTFEHTAVEALVESITAVLSIGTAAALIAVMPAILRLVSPKARHEELMRVVDERTRENMELAREINHQLGNQLQVLTSAIRIEKRRATTIPEHTALERIGDVVDELAERYRKTKLEHADELGEISTPATGEPQLGARGSVI